MKTVANQKIIVNNVKVTGRYIRIDEATFTAGCRDLKPTTFLVWQALDMQYFTDKELALSTSQISTLMGDMRKRTIQDAIIELIEKGWLVLVSGNVYSLRNPMAESDICYAENRHSTMTKTATEIRIKSKREEEQPEETDDAAEGIIDDAADEKSEQYIINDITCGNSLEHLRAADKTEKRCFQIGKFAPWFGSSAVDGKPAAKLEMTIRELGEHVQKNYENYGCGSLTSMEQIYDMTWKLWSAAKEWRVASRI